MKENNQTEFKLHSLRLYTLDKLIHQYGYSSIVLFVFFGLLGADSIGSGWEIYFYNLLSLFSYWVLLKNVSVNNDRFFNIINLWRSVFIYSVLMVSILNIIYYSHH